MNATSPFPSGGQQPDFKALFESAPGPSLILAPDQTIIAASDAYLRAAGLQRAQIAGRTLLDVFSDDSGSAIAAVARNLGPSLQRVLQT